MAIIIINMKMMIMTTINMMMMIMTTINMMMMTIMTMMMNEVDDDYIFLMGDDYIF